MQSVRQWLEQLGLPQYAPIFEQNAVDLSIAVDLTQQDLRDLGVEALGHRKVLLRAIAELKAVQEQRVQEPPPGERTPAAEAERRQITVLFCDLVGSTELAARLDPEELREVMRDYHAACAGVVAEYEGHIAQYLGDGLLVYFGYPQAHEDDARRAVCAGLRIIAAMRDFNATASRSRDVRLGVRIGIHTGPVVIGEVGAGARHELLALGETPNLAARLQAMADPAATVVSGATLRLVRGLFQVRDLGRHTLKGAPTPIEVYEVLAETAAQSRLDVERSIGFTRLVGREREVGLLLERWEQVAEGRGEAVLVNGEAGIGKSRLVQALKERIGSTQHTLLECRCSSYLQHSQLYPVIELLQGFLEWTAEDTLETKLRKLESRMAQYVAPVDGTVPLLASLLSLQIPDSEPAPSMSAELRKKKTIEAVIATFLAISSVRPVLFIVEDLHWVDPSTLELLSLLLEQVPTGPILMLMTTRPAYRPPWTPRSYLTWLTLNRLNREQTRLMVQEVARGKRLPGEVAQQIVAKTDGVPLFVEELTKMVQESGLLAEHADHYDLRGALTPLAIPSTLHDSLMARLDRLESVKAVAQQGAILGREFPYGLLRAVSLLDDATLQRALARLVDAELLYQRGVVPHATYVFKHALVQDVAYQSVLKSTRQQSHQRIAQVLQADFPAIREVQPELLAHHYTEAGLVLEAISWWQRAGQRSFERSAHVEAITHLEKGLDLAATIPDARQRGERELSLLNALGLTFFAVKGQASEEAGRTYVRARQICEELQETAKLPSVLSGLFSFHIVRAEFGSAWDVAEQLLALAQRQGDATRHLVAAWAIGETLLFRGEFAPALAQLEQARVLSESRSRSNRSLSLVSGFPGDLGVFDMCFLAHTLWHMGHADQAVNRMNEAVSFARDLSHPFSLAVSLDYQAMLYQFRREAKCVQASAESAIALCKEQGFAYYLAWGNFMRGWALREQGQDEAGTVQLREGLAAMRATGAALRLPYYLGLLAQTCASADHAGDGLALLDEALARIEKTGERWDAAELHRIQGELLIHSLRLHEAEKSMQRAFDIARRQGARSLELRSSVSLARLWQTQGKYTQARDLVSKVYAWFTEGFDTKDLKEAKALLDGLS